jgi:hydroxymethylglutaryl-CoA reductase (NADPH)
MEKFANIPMKIIGPLKIKEQNSAEEISVPLATLEKPLWFSVARGAKVSCLTSAGINTTLIQSSMTRSILLEAASAQDLFLVFTKIKTLQKKMAEVVLQTSQHAKLESWHGEIVGNLLFLRFSFFVGDAAGHNMATKASEALLNWLLKEFSALKYVSISGNYCADKKASAVNGILGRGKNVIAEILIPHEICIKHLKTAPEEIVNLNVKKNLIGSILAGSLRSANAHFANMLLAFYLAFGQDAANIVEGSQGITYANITSDNSLYFSVTLPNVIVGTIGAGKNLAFVQENLALVRCNAVRENGESANRLAKIAAAVVLCGELSLLAAQTNRGELMRGHVVLER